MTDLIFHHEADQLRSQTANEIPVLMYGSRPPARGTCSIGGAGSRRSEAFGGSGQ